MAEHLISYEQNWGRATLGDVEKRHVLGLLDENGQDTELGFIIELANMLGLKEKAKLAELKRKERLASMFQNSRFLQTSLRNTPASVNTKSRGLLR